MPLVSRASIFIDAPRQAVWAALMQRSTLLAIMPVTEVVLGWRVGEPFLWIFEFGDRRSHVEGFVHRMEEDRLLEYEYGDPYARDVLRSATVHRVTIELADERGGTRITAAQDDNATLDAHAHAEGGWRLALHNLKHLVELEEQLRLRISARIAR